MTIDDLFPMTSRRDPPRPIPGLTIVGGLAVWGLDVRYHRNPLEITVSAVMFVPSRDTTTPISVRNERIFRVPDLGNNPEFALALVMRWLRDFAVHEVLEGFVVAGRPFFQVELDRDHGEP